MITYLTLGVLTLLAAGTMLSITPAFVVAIATDTTPYRHVAEDRGKPVITATFGVSATAFVVGLFVLYGMS